MIQILIAYPGSNVELTIVNHHEVVDLIVVMLHELQFWLPTYFNQKYYKKFDEIFS